MKRVALMFNPISGAGRAEATARALADRLDAASIEVERVGTSLDDTDAWLDPVLERNDLLVVVGGDGAMRMAVPSALRTGTPVYHAPTGTENLFAREFGTKARPERLMEALERGHVAPVDVARTREQVFVLMASMGYDANVIEDLSARRTGAISHLSYVAPMTRQWCAWRPVPLSIEVDGTPVVEEAPGIAIVANSRQYAMRIDPAVRASMTDGVLDVVFLPCRSRRDILRWLWACRRRRHLDDARVVYVTGRAARVRAAEPMAVQLDGDDGGRTADFEASMHADPLLVLR